MVGRAKGGVFISYRRADGEAFATRLRERLRAEAPDVQIKQDRLVLEGGVGWWNQLSAAIDSVEFLVLVMTPQAMTSEVVRKEWRYARQQGVCIYPVKAAPDAQLDFAAVPRWMGRAHFFDLDKEWPTFLGHLRAGCRSPHVPFMAPDLPPNFVQRPPKFEALKQQLLGGQSTAITGGGGFGKTTMAAALCHDPDIIENFDDGVLWVKLGQTPDLLAEATTVHAALTDTRPAFASVPDAAYKIGEVLADRVCLIVIDDVWQASHLKPFTRGGPSCVRLITTRDVGIAADEVKQRITIDQMSAEESLGLLQSGLPELDQAEVAQLAQLLGNWPLRLELGRALLHRQLARGYSSTGALRYLRTALEREGPGALPVDAVIQASLETLSAADQTRLEQFSIFPEGIAIPIAVVGALWGLDEFWTEKSSVAIADTSLLRFDPRSAELTIHSDLRSWLGRRVGDAAALHARLVDAWPDWCALPNDYAWRRLVWHLARADRADSLLRTLRDPKWIDGKLKATEVNALIGDYDLAGPSPEIDRLQHALRLSAHVLAGDPAQLRSQLAGRLGPEDPIAAGVPIAAVSLTPQTQTLTPPGGLLSRTLIGHSFGVTSMVVTPDGRAVSVSDGDCTLKVWSLAEGSELSSLFSPQSPFTRVALADGGQSVVAARKDGTLKVFDVASGTERLSISGHKAEVNGIAVATAARRIVSADNDGVLKLWNLDDGAELRALTGPGERLEAVDITPDGRRAVSCCADGTLAIWDLDSGNKLGTLTEDNDLGFPVAMTRDGKRAVVGNAFDGTLKVWDLDERRVLLTLKGHEGRAWSVVLSADEKRAVSGGQEGDIRIWDLEIGRELGTLLGHTNQVTAVAVTDAGDRVVSASFDSTIKVWSLSRGQEISVLARTRQSIEQIAVTIDCKRALSSDWNSLTLWEVATRRPVWTKPAPADGVTALAISPDGKMAVLASNHRVALWELEAARELRTWSRPPSWRVALAITQDARIAIVPCGKSLVVLDVETGRELRTLPGHDDEINDVQVTRDGRTIVSVSARTLKVWDLDSGREQCTIVGSSAAHIVKLAIGSTRAVALSSDQTLRGWELQTGTALPNTTELPNHYVTDFALTSDGVRAALAIGLEVWLLNLHTSVIEAVFICDGAVRCCAFAGADLLLVGDAIGAVHFLVVERADGS